MTNHQLRNYFFFISLLLLVNVSALAQPKEALHAYTNVAGDFFWPMRLPMYLHFSDETSGDGSVLLKSRLTPEATNPLYFEKEGLNFIRSRWAVDQNGRTISPKKEVAFEIYIDGLPPMLDVNFTQKPYESPFNELFYSANLEISLTVTDQTSGVNQVLASIDNSTFNAYQNPLVFSKDGNYKFETYAIDNVGNTSALIKHEFIVDGTPPSSSTLVKVNFKGSILSGKSILSIERTDALSGVKNTYYSLNDAPYQRYYEQIPTADLKDGTHKVTYYSIDNVGNKENEKTYEFYMDKTPPEIYATLIGDQYQNRGRIFVSDRSNVSLTASDNMSGVKLVTYQIDGGETKEYLETFTLSRSEGLHFIKVIAIDELDNRYEELFDERNLGRKGLDIDMNPPIVDHQFNGPQYLRNDTIYINSQTAIQLKAVDKVSGLKKIGYKLNEGAGIDYLDVFNVDKEGIYKVDFFATDNIYNRNSSEFYFAVDNSGPIVHSFFSSGAIGQYEENEEKIKVYAKGVKLYLAASDEITETEDIFFKINGEETSRYETPITFNRAGINVITVNAKDKLGNNSLEQLTMKVMIAE